MQIKAVINMKFYRLSKTLSFVFIFICVIHSSGWAQSKNQVEDKLPAREYTNPDEIVTFDRTTSFSRALDVINEFAQKYRNKMIIDRTKTEGNIGISVPPMHWMDALKLILNVKKLSLVEQKKYYEIVNPKSLQPQAKQASSSGSGSGNKKAPVATTHSKEVRIKAIFFEGNRRALQEIGVDWSTISENVPDAILGGGQGGQSGGGGGSSSGSQQGPQIPNSSFNGPFVQVNAKGAQSVSQNIFSSLINVGEVGNTGIRVQALFSAFEADNLGQILASPNIKVMDGQQGRIQVGQDFSIKQRDFSGNVVDKFFSVGTILEVTPNVIVQNDTTFIHLDINAQRSNAQPDPVSTIINKQQAQTQAILLPGESTVIAGLYNTESTDVRKGIPILKDLPPWFFGLRYLFGYNSKSYQSRELVILIQASLEPSIPDRIAQEGDFKGSYEVIQNERKKMDNELKHGQKVLKGKRKKQNPKNETSEKQDITTQNQNMVKKQKPVKQEKKTEENVAQEHKPDSTKKAAKKEVPTVSDLEVHDKKIQLDLGGEKDQSHPTISDSVSTGGQQAVKQKTQPAKTSTQKKSTSERYYIIGGSFKKEKNAKDYRDKLEDKGFNPVILEEGNFMFVSYKGYDDLGSAKNAVSEIQQHQNPNAWLYEAH